MAEVYSGELSIEKAPINFGNFNIPIVKGEPGVGRSLEFIWEGTRLGVKLEEEQEYQFVELKGEKGDKGENGLQGEQGNQGVQGVDGPEGKSAYEVALKNGFAGNEDDWLKSLIGNVFYRDVMNYVTTKAIESKIELPKCYNENSILDVFVSGIRLNANKYSVTSENNRYYLNFVNALDVIGTEVDICITENEHADYVTKDYIDEQLGNIESLLAEV